MKFFVRICANFASRNRLQETVQNHLQQFDHTLIDHPETFINQLKADIEGFKGFHPRCNPETVKVTVAKRPLENIRLWFGGDPSSEHTFSGIELHLVKESQK